MSGAIHTHDQVGVKESVSSKITNKTVVETPIIAKLRKPKGKRLKNAIHTSMLTEYQDVHHRGVRENEDAVEFHGDGRTPLFSVWQKMERNISVTCHGEKQEIHGAKSEVAFQMARAAVYMRKKWEMRIASNEDNEMEDGVANFYETRGIMNWIAATPWTGQTPAPAPGQASQKVFPVPADCRPSPDSQYTGPLGSLTEDVLGDLLEAAYCCRDGSVDLDGFVGIKLKRKISQMSQYHTNAARFYFRQVNQPTPKHLDVMLDVYSTDAGRLTMHLDNWLMVPEDGVRTEFSKRSGMFIDTDAFALVMEKVQKKKLEYRGGGHRFLVWNYGALECLNPCGHVSIVTDQD